MWMVLPSLLVLSVCCKIILLPDLLPKPFLCWLFWAGHSQLPFPCLPAAKSLSEIAVKWAHAWTSSKASRRSLSSLPAWAFPWSHDSSSMFWTLAPLWVSHNTSEVENVLLPFTITKCTIKEVLGELGPTSAYPTASLLHDVSLYHICAHGIHLPYRPVLTVSLPIQSFSSTFSSYL